MATNKKDMLRGGLRNKKTASVKLPSRKVSDIDRTTEQVHSKREEVLPKQIKRTSIDFPLSYYQAIKRASFDQGITFKEFILKLVQQELNLEDFK